LCFVFVLVTSWIDFLFSAQGTIHEITRIKERAGKWQMKNEKSLRGDDRNAT
jgi:hypothetical protein